MNEYHFKIGPVTMAVIADSVEEAVQKANRGLPRFNSSIPAPSDFEWVQVDFQGQLTAKDIADVTVIG